MGRCPNWIRPLLAACLGAKALPTFPFAGRPAAHQAVRPGGQRRPAGHADRPPFPPREEGGSARRLCPRGRPLCRYMKKVDRDPSGSVQGEKRGAPALRSTAARVHGSRPRREPLRPGGHSARSPASTPAAATSTHKIMSLKALGKP